MAMSPWGAILVLFPFSPFMRLEIGSTWETASSHPCRTPDLLTEKGSPKDPEDIGKLLKLLLQLPNTDLSPLFSSSTFWFDSAGVKGEDELLLLTDLEKIELELVAELLVTWEKEKGAGPPGPLFTGWGNVKNPEVIWLWVFSGSDSVPNIGLNTAFSRGLKLISVFSKPELTTVPVSDPNVEVLEKTPRLVGDLKLNPEFSGRDELEDPEVATKAGACSSPEKIPELEVWVSPNDCPEE